MGLTVANNVSSLIAQHNLGRSNHALKTSLERLSSGFQINRGADGPAALVISEKQRAQIAGLDQAIENTEKAVAVVQTAEGALAEINNLLVKVRSLAIDSANTGVNDADALAANQAEIDNALDTINRIANNTQFATKKLLDGTSGISGTPSDTDVNFLRATENTAAGTYSVVVTTAGEGANLATGITAQTAALANDEILTLNGVTITLSAGLDQDDVVNRINEFTSQTGVKADTNGAGGATRLYTEAYGSNANIEVISNQAAAANSSGIGTTTLTDAGVNVVATVDGTTFNGSGNVLTVNSGPANGLSISFEAQTGANAHSTVTGAQGTVTIADNSLVFQIGANQNQTAKLNIARVNPASLGIGVTGNQFANLDQINVTSANRATRRVGRY